MHSRRSLQGAQANGAAAQGHDPGSTQAGHGRRRVFGEQVSSVGQRAEPGGNITGVAWFWLGLKQVELLKEIVPNLRRVAYVTGVIGPGYASEVAAKIFEPDKSQQARLELHSRFFELPMRTTTTKSLPASWRNILMLLLFQRNR